MYFREKNIEKKMIQENLEEKLFKRGGQWKEEWISSNSEEAIINFLKFCINKLKDQSKQVLLLRFYQNKKTEEICTICNITKDNLWQILHRSKLQLKVCIQSKLKVTND
jgi:RNA polymerase sigma-70 factor (ECF subfamily)